MWIPRHSGDSCPYALVAGVGGPLQPASAKLLACVSSKTFGSLLLLRRVGAWVASSNQRRADAQLVLVCRLTSFLGWTGMSTGLEALRYQTLACTSPAWAVDSAVDNSVDRLTDGSGRSRSPCVSGGAAQTNSRLYASSLLARRSYVSRETKEVVRRIGGRNTC